MFCVKCGHKLLEGSEFCTKCGAKVQTIHAAPPVNVSPGAAPTAPANSNLAPFHPPQAPVYPSQPPVHPNQPPIHSNQSPAYLNQAPTPPAAQANAGNNENQGGVISACKKILWLRVVSLPLWVIVGAVLLITLTTVPWQWWFSIFLLAPCVIITYLGLASVLRIRSTISSQTVFDHSKLRAFAFINGLMSLVGAVLTIALFILLRGPLYIVLFPVEVAIMVFAYKTLKSMGESMGEIADAEMTAEISGILTNGENIQAIGTYVHHLSNDSFAHGFAVITNLRLIYRSNDGFAKDIIAFLPALGKFLKSAVRENENSLLNGEFIIALADIARIEVSKDDVIIHINTGEVYKLTVPNKDDGHQWRQALRNMTPHATSQL